jgi:uncharacterized protein (TIGR00725 family)
MGPGKECPDQIARAAYELGVLLARERWTVLSGGRDMGVMDAVSRGANEAGGLTVGILPSKESSVSPFVELAIVTDVNLARNNINVVTSDVVVSCGMGVGTASEVALGLNAGKHVILLHAGEDALRFFKGLRPHLTHEAASPGDVVVKITELRASGAITNA